MYQLVSARYRTDRRAGRWMDADLANVPVTTVASVYGDVWLYITYPSLTTPKALRFSKVVNLVTGVSPSTTVQQWLDSLGNKTLPFETTLPNKNTRLVRYAQAWHAGYDIKPVARLGHVDSALSKFDREDLLLNHPKFTPEKIATQAMFTVNGLFHLADYAADGVRIIDGNQTLRKGNDNQIGIYTFEEISTIKYCPITNEMVKASSANAQLKDGVYVTIPEQYNIDNKTLLLVMGGYLQVLDKTYTRVGDRTYRLNVNSVLTADRYMQLVENTDVSKLGVDISESDPSFISTQTLASDSFIRNYLTQSRSFFVIVDTDIFFQELVPLESLKLPGRFVALTDERLPVMGAYGRMLDYHTIKEEDRYVYCAVDNVRHNYDFHQRKWRKLKAINAGRYPAKPKEHAGAFLRLMGTEN